MCKFYSGCSGVRATDSRIDFLRPLYRKSLRESATKTYTKRYVKLPGMKYKLSISIIVTLGCLLLSNSALGQKKMKITILDCNIDSIFVANFNRMDNSVKLGGLDDFSIDRVFVYVITHLSGIDYETSDYSGFPYFNSTNLKEWGKWYKLNKEKISCELYLRAYELIMKFPKTESEIEELNNLKIY